MNSLILLIFLYIFFYFGNTYLISKIWFKRYINFNFFERYIISFLLLIFIMFLSLSPFYVIFENIKLNENDSKNIFMILFLIFQAILIIIYLFNFKKIKFNFDLDWRKIVIFLSSFSIITLIWYMNVYFGNNDIFLGNNLLINEIDKSKYISLFEYFNTNVLINIVYRTNIIPSESISIFKNHAIIISMLFMLSLACSSCFDYFNFVSFKNIKLIIFEIFTIALFLFVVNYSFVNELNFLGDYIYWAVPFIVLVFSIVSKTNKNISTNSDLSIVVNLVILTLPFFNKNMYFISIFMFLLFVFYMYNMNFENTTFELLKLFAYVMFSYSISNLLIIPNQLGTIISSSIFLLLSIIIIIVINSFTKTYRFYNRVQKIDHFISSKVLILFIFLVLSIIFVSLFILNSNLNFSLYKGFFEINGIFSLPFLLVITTLWVFSLSVILWFQFINFKSVKIHNSFLLTSIFLLLIFNPFSKNFLEWMFADKKVINSFYFYSIFLFSAPLSFSIIESFNISFKEIYIEKKILKKILFLLGKIGLPLLMVVVSTLMLLYCFGV